uniref:Orf77 n=1 Tax=Brassica oleracea var. oleracea TaxID=109376 RepID=A0A0D3CHF0_BRAOL
MSSTFTELQFEYGSLAISSTPSNGCPATHCHSVEDILTREPCYYCIVDASWKSPHERADIHGVVRPIQIFTTKKYWILFRIGPERRRKAGMPPGVYY